MIRQVGQPRYTPRRWVERIQRLNEQFYFMITPKDIKESWWWVAVLDNDVVGFAGCKPEAGKMFLGPCGVLEHARGRGIQREFIQARVRCGEENGFGEAVSYTDRDNLYSANNFLRSGFLLREAWRRFPVGSDNLYFGRVLTNVGAYVPRPIR